MRSLTTKLTLAFLAVGLMGAILLAFFIDRSTQREFDQFVTNRDRYAFNEVLAEYYQGTGSWQGVAVVFVLALFVCVVLRGIPTAFGNPSGSTRSGRPSSSAAARSRSRIARSISRTET